MLDWSTPDVKQLNKERIRRKIQGIESFTKSFVANQTMLSFATCNTLLNEMLESGEIKPIGQKEINMGRPAKEFTYNADFHHVLGLFISKDSQSEGITYSISDALGKPLVENEVRTESINFDQVREIIQAETAKDSLIQRITFGIPGISTHGVIEYCDIKSMTGIDVEKSLKDEFGIDVEVRNDMDFISYGVYHTFPHENGNLAAIYFPESNEACIGSGFVIDGKVLRGHSKFAGEISYIAEGFGISRSEQTILMEDPAALTKLASQMTLIAIGTVDPEVVVLLGADLEDSILDTVREYCEKIVTNKHIPNLLVGNDIRGYYKHGLTRFALNHLQFPISGFNSF